MVKEVKEMENKSDTERKTYFGSKLIIAEPMNRQVYNDYRGWELPSDEDGTDEGYLVEYTDSPDSNHENHKGYISWSPAEQFEKAYREITGLSYGQAIEAMNQGYKVRRSGWNGKGICVYKVSGGSLELPASHIDYCDDFFVEVGPHIVIDTTGLITTNSKAPKTVVPWLPSQTDQLFDDWEIILPE